MTWRWKLLYPIPVPWVTRAVITMSFLCPGLALLLASSASELWLNQMHCFPQTLPLWTLVYFKGHRTCGLWLYCKIQISPFALSSLTLRSQIFAKGWTPFNSQQSVLWATRCENTSCVFSANVSCFTFCPIFYTRSSWKLVALQPGKYLHTSRAATVWNCWSGL